MKKKYNNLNEEINRIKQLFGGVSEAIITESDDKLLGYIQKIENLQRELDKITSSDERKKQIDLINKTLNITKEYIKSNNITVDPTLKLKLTNIEKVSSEITGLMNEEVDRIKSLFTEERLYGNLVDKAPKLITEQKWSKLLDDLFRGFLKGKTNKFTFSRVPGDARKPLSIKKVGNDIELRRGGVKIDPNSMDDVLSSVTLRKIRTVLSDIRDEKSLNDFLSGEGFEKIQRDIINDLKIQGFMDELRANELLLAIKEQNVGKEIGDRIMPNGKISKDYFENIYSLSDLKRVNPELYKYFEDIPGFEKKLKNVIKKSDIDFYDDEIVDLIRFLRGTDSGEDMVKYKELNPGHMNRYQVHFNIPASKKAEIDKIKKAFSNREQVSVVGTGDEFKITINTDALDAKTQKFFDDATSPPSKPYARNLDNEIDVEASGRRDRSRIFDDEDINKQINKIIDNMDDKVVRKRMGVRSNKDIIANIKASLGEASDFVKPVTDFVKDTFNRKFFKGYDWVNWKKKGYGTGVGIDSKLQLNTVQQEFADNILVVEGRTNGITTPWVDAKLDPKLIKKGYTEGTLHPNAKLRPDWRNKIYVKHNRLLSRSIQSLFPKTGFKDFVSWNKYVGRVLKRLVVFWPYGGGVMITHLFQETVRLFMSQVFRGAINKALESDANIHSLVTTYAATCSNAITGNIENSKVLNDDAKYSLLGMTTENKGTEDGKEYTEVIEIQPGKIKGVLNKLGKIEVTRDNGSITGTAPIYSPVDYSDIDVFDWFTKPGGVQDDKFLDVLSEDKRAIVEDNIIYEIDSAVGMGGDSWEVVSYTDIPKDKLSGIDLDRLGGKKKPFLLVYLNSDGSLCDGRTNTDCNKVYFSLTCGNFADFFSKYSKDEIRKIVEDLGWGVFWGYMWGNEKTFEELFIEKVNNAKIGAMETIDANNDGEITVDDGKTAVEKAQGTVSGGVGGRDLDKKGAEGFKKKQ